MKINFLKRYPLLPIFLILILAAFLRLYRISDYMTFLGDEGRDALVWLHMARDHKLTLIGPTTSIGNMYLGPLYYYLMLPFFVIFGLSPVGASIGVGLFSLLTIFLLYRFGKEWFGEKAALLAALFYSISPVVIAYSRSSWNPNVMPFFALISVWGVWQVWQKKQYWWLLVVGISSSFALQSHYLGLLLLPTILIFWFLTFRNLLKSQVKKIRPFLLYSAFGFAAFIFLTIVPLVWFDLRHNFLNLNAFRLFFTDRQTTVNFKMYKAIPQLWPLFSGVITDIITAKEQVFGLIFSLFTIITAIWIGVKQRAQTKIRPLFLLLSWLGIGFVGLGLYKQHLYDHYYGFIFPALFLLLGLILQTFWEKGKVGRIIFLVAVIALTFVNLKNLSLWQTPNNQLGRVQEVDKKILAESGGKPFNIALISKQNYQDGYYFFLDLWGHKPLIIDPQKFNETATTQLFVVCEDSVCEPIGHPRTEIASFGWAKIEQEWQFPWGTKLFKLVQSQEAR